jgi:hypothetical protein
MKISKAERILRLQKYLFVRYGMRVSIMSSGYFNPKRKRSYTLKHNQNTYYKIEASSCYHNFYLEYSRMPDKSDIKNEDDILFILLEIFKKSSKELQRLKKIFKELENEI